MEGRTVARQWPFSERSALLEEYVPGLSNKEYAQQHVGLGGAGGARQGP